jgi:predicted Zn-dependent protease
MAAMLLGLAPGEAQAQGGIQLARDSEIEQTLRLYSEPLFEAAGLDSKAIRIFLVQDRSMNAFVAGGQNMFVHTGLIMNMKSANELKGVIAHETGHIAGGHLARSREAMAAAQGPALLTIGLGILAIAAGAPDAGAALISGAPQIGMGAFVEYFSRAQESSADQAAVTYLEATGQSGRGLLEFADRQFRYNEMLSIQRVPPWMRTHPLWTDRIQALRQRVTQGAHFNTAEDADHAERFTVMQAKLFGYLEPPAATLRRYPSSDVSRPARYARAIAAMRDSRLPQALTEARALLADQPNNPFFMELAGEIALEMSDVKAAAEFHRAALAKRPDDALFRVNLARALLAPTTNAGVDEAIEHLQRASVIETGNTTAWSLLSQAYDRIGQEGMAQLSQAELRFAIGDYMGAVSFATRAQDKLTRNTPAFTRAADILTLSSPEIGVAPRARPRPGLDHGHVH